MTPQLLGFKIVPHGLLPSTKIRTGEDGDGGVESVVVVGGHFAFDKVSVKKRRQCCPEQQQEEIKAPGQCPGNMLISGALNREKGAAH